MNAEELIKSNSLSNIPVDGSEYDKFQGVAFEAVNKARIEAYNQAIEDVLDITCKYDNDVSNTAEYEILKLKK